VPDVLTLLDLDPNIVKPGWTPLIITIALGAAIVLLYFSLRKQFRKIEKTFPMPEPPSAGTQAPAAPNETAAPKA